MHSYENKRACEVNTRSLNPCFNGRCTRTYGFHTDVKELDVLILVLMEDALVPA